MERITELEGPPVVGRFYLVPTVTYHWMGDVARPWPVFLPRHEDKEHLKFAHHHYHVDPRFVGGWGWRAASEWYGLYSERRTGDTDADAFLVCQGVPLSRYAPNTIRPTPHPPVQWRSRRCVRSVAVYQPYASEQLTGKLEPVFAGRQCSKGRHGWVCPHKAFGLGSIAPDEHGVITCPVHGLRIEAASGVVLGGAA